MRRARVHNDQGHVLPVVDVCPKCSVEILELDGYSVVWLRVADSVWSNAWNYKVNKDHIEQRALHLGCLPRAYNDWPRWGWVTKGDFIIIDTAVALQELKEDFEEHRADAAIEEQRKAG